ncbi:MAG: hypothetical protein VX335_03050, partial [Pseudomonadota bacterium]|nr:hypothetical protein [Pseudomonadota bacterium]
MTLAVFLSSNDDFLLSDILVRNIHDCYGEKVIYIILNSKDLIFPAEFFRDNNNYKHVEKVTPLIDILQQSFSDGKFGKKKIKNIKHLKKVVEFFEREYVESIFLICENNIFSN